MSTPVILAPVANQYFPDSSGRPLSGGFVYTYAAGSSAQAATYVDAGGIIKNTNPVQLDSGGKAAIWLGPQSYKFVVQDANGVQQWVIDDIPGATVQPSLSLPEGSALTGAAGSDLVYASLASHRVAMNNNNTGEDLIVGQHSIDTLTNKTLTAPVLTSPTTTGSDIGAETFQNKTLTAGGNTVVLLDVQGPKAAITGDVVSQKTMYTYTIPATAVQAGKGIIVEITWGHTSGSGNVDLGFFLGGVEIDNPSPVPDAGSNRGTATYHIFNNSGVRNAQSWVGRRFWGATTGYAVTNGTAAADLSAATIIKFTCQSAASEQVTPLLWFVWLIQ